MIEQRREVEGVKMQTHTQTHTHTHTKLSADFLDFFAHLRVKSNEALDVDEIFLEE